MERLSVCVLGDSAMEEPQIRRLSLKLHRFESKNQKRPTDMQKCLLNSPLLNLTPTLSEYVREPLF